MKNSSKCFQNKECEYYPCHKGIDEINCLFCYCPFYGWKKCPGKNSYIYKPDGRQIKVCTECVFSHKPENYDKVIEYLIMGEDAFAKRVEERRAIFYGIGVGPGESELLTKKAEKIIRGVDVLILPAKDRNSCRAYQIVKGAIPEIDRKECVFIPFPMAMKEPELTNFHKEVAKRVEDILNQEKSVGFLTIGDVNIYSTFVYIEQQVKKDGYDTEYISGITSFSAVSSRLAMPLVMGDEELHIIPGSADVSKALNLSGTLVFMKSGKRLGELKRMLLEMKMKENIEVQAVSNCGLENEVVSYSLDEICEDSGYLTVVIVKK